MKKRRLITSALPYVNNIPHLGNLTQVLSADVYARFCRSRGYETLYICGTDEYGTATETRALLEKVTPRELCDYYNKIHKDIYKWFNISFDYFGRTSTEKQTEIVQSLFNDVEKAGYINEKEIEQLYCPTCKRFLADRFVEGTCPSCDSDDARGDQCNNCGKLLEPTELIDSHCSVCHSKPEVKKTKHLYLDLPKALPLLEKWMEKASVDGYWANNAIAVTKSWIRDGLKERCITRDLKWGIPVPKKGYEDKVFYVWFDAPIGYISITAEKFDDYKNWWQNPENTELYQFIGKDNIPFHTVIFPSTLLASNRKWTMLHHMSSSEYLNYEGGKFSKSKGIGIFGNDVQSTNIDADIWRFWMYYNRPEKSDVLFTWKDFEQTINKELIGNVSNLVNRTLTFVKKNYGNSIFEEELDSKLVKEIQKREDEITNLMEKAEIRDSLRKICQLSDLGNKLFQEAEPWKNKETTKGLLKTLVYLIKDLAILLSPFIPESSDKIFSFFNLKNQNWSNLLEFDSINSIDNLSYLFKKLDSKHIESLKEKFSGSQEQRKAKKENNKVSEEELSNAELFNKTVRLISAKIIDVEKHPEGDKLYILTLDTKKENDRVIVSSIVPYYKKEELLNRNIVLVDNLKPAKFRGVKSYGMLLAAAKEGDTEHSTCEVLFVDEVEEGTEFILDGMEQVEQKSKISANRFFNIPIYAKDGKVYVDNKPLKAGEYTLSTKVYLNGEVG